MWTKVAMMALPFAASATSEGCHVIVVGSGISGLATAQSLRRLNCSSTVLEARDEIGGRTHTVTKGPFTGVELGAHWVHGGLDNAVSMPVLNYLGIPVVPVGGDDDFEGKRGHFEIMDGRQPLSKDRRRSAFKLLRQIMRKVARHLEAVMDDDCDGGARCRAQDISEQAAWDDVVAALDPQPSAEDMRAVSLLKLMKFEQDYGNSPSLCGGRIGELTDDVDFYPDGGLGDAFVEGGYISLVRALAVGLDIRVSSPVTNIEHSDEGVKVEANGEIFQGTHVVVTPHAHLLPQLSFTPEMPSWKSNSFSRIGAGKVGKLLVLLEKPLNATDKKGYTFGRMYTEKSDLITMCVHSASEHPRPSNFNFGRTLECFQGAEALAAATDMDDEMRISVAQAQLREIFGEDVVVEATKLTPWHTDPYVGLAWTFPPVGSVVQDFFDYAKPVGRVHFAGEGSCLLMWGNVHAALATAGRAVHELLPESLRAAAADDDWPLFRSDIRNACEEPMNGLASPRSARWAAHSEIAV